MPVGVQGTAILYAEKETSAKKVALQLLKFGCRVSLIENKKVSLDSLANISDYNCFIPIKTVTLEEAKSLYSEERARAFFSDATTVKEAEEASEIVGEKVFAPLILMY